MPTIKGILTLTLSSIMFGALAGRLIFSTKIIEGLSDIIIIYGIAFFFLLLFFGCVYYLMTIKIVYINKFNGLTIQYPLIFKKVDIDFKKLKNISEQPFLIKHKGDFETKADIIYSGKRVTFLLENNKNIELNSFMTEDFYKLKNYIEKHNKAN